MELIRIHTIDNVHGLLVNFTSLSDSRRLREIFYILYGSKFHSYRDISSSNLSFESQFNKVTMSRRMIMNVIPNVLSFKHRNR